MSPSFARHAIVLGLLSAVGPFAIDMYLPSLPAISASLQADTGAVQLSLIAFFVALGVCQLIYGPLSDMLGRRPPLYFGMALYFVGAVGAALASDITMLIVWRAVQGVGACAGATIPRAVVRDLHTGPEATRLMSLIMLVFSVSPLLAPLLGSVIAETIGWRAIFWFLSGLALAGMVVVAVFLPETLGPDARIRPDWRAVVGGYRTLLRDRWFVGVSLIGGFGLASFFVYITSSSFLFIGHFGLTPTEFSLVFASNAIAFIGLAQFNAAMTRRFGMARVVRTAVIGFAALTGLLFIAALIGIAGFPVLWGLMLASFGCLGFVVPVTAVLALEHHGPIAGMASSLLGTLQLLTGAAVAGVVSAFGPSPLPITAALAACGLAALLIALSTLRRAGPRRPAAG